MGQRVRGGAEGEGVRQRVEGGEGVGWGQRVRRGSTM